MSEREKLVEVMAEAICDAMNMNRVGRLELDAATAALAALEAAGVRLVPVEAVNAALSLIQEIEADEDMSAVCYYARTLKPLLAASPYAKDPGNG